MRFGLFIVEVNDKPSGASVPPQAGSIQSLAQPENASKEEQPSKKESSRSKKTELERHAALHTPTSPVRWLTHSTSCSQPAKMCRHCFWQRVLPRLVIIVQAVGLIKGSAEQAGLSVLPAANPAISSRDLKTASVAVPFADTQVAPVLSLIHI